MSTSNGNESIEEVICRRGIRRVSIPVELRIEFGDHRVKAVIRDASVDETEMKWKGIGILHTEELPLGEPLACEAQAKQLPGGFHITLVWTRHFGVDGYLSGGKVTFDPSDGEEWCEPT